MSLYFASIWEQQLTAPAVEDEASERAKSARSELRKCRNTDLVRIAEIHKAQFGTPGTLLGRLSNALIATFYSGFIGRPIFLVHSTNAQVDGFVLGGSHRELKRCKLAGLRKRPLLYFMDIVRRPDLWWRATRPIAKLLGNRLVPAIGASPREEYRLLSIAVAPEGTSRGIGQALVRGFEEAIREVSNSYDLRVLKNNDRAIRFYEKLGFEHVGETSCSWTFRKTLAPRVVVDESRATQLAQSPASR